MDPKEEQEQASQPADFVEKHKTMSLVCSLTNDELQQYGADLAGVVQDDRHRDSTGRQTSRRR